MSCGQWTSIVHNNNLKFDKRVSVCCSPDQTKAETFRSESIVTSWQGEGNQHAHTVFKCYTLYINVRRKPFTVHLVVISRNFLQPTKIPPFHLTEDRKTKPWLYCKYQTEGARTLENLCTIPRKSSKQLATSQTMRVVRTTLMLNYLCQFKGFSTRNRANFCQ